MVVTTSGQEALVAALKACFTEERRGVVVMEPFYPFLAPAIAAAGGVMQPARLSVRASCWTRRRSTPRRTRRRRARC